MLNIKRNELNKLVVSVSRHKTLANPSYLFSFEHILSKEKVRFYPKNISTSSNRYDEFEFIEGNELTPLTPTDIPKTIFPYPGQYYYGIYEMFSTGTTNPQYAFSKLEEGRAFVEDTSIPDDYSYVYTSSNENNSNYVYYKPNTNNPYQYVKLNISGFNSDPNYVWNYKYPDHLLEDLTTGETLRAQPTLFNSVGSGPYCGVGYVQYSAETIYKKVLTGNTSNSTSFKIYLDPDQVIAYGYDYGIQENPIVISAITYSYFRPVTIGGVEQLRSDFTRHFTDGTTTTGSSVWINNQRNYEYLPITGNTFQEFVAIRNGFTGTTYDAAGQQTSNGSIYFSYPYNNWYSTYSADTIQYSLTRCEQTPASQIFYYSETIGGVNYIGSGDTSGNFNFIGVYCVQYQITWNSFGTFSAYASWNDCYGAPQTYTQLIIGGGSLTRYVCAEEGSVIASGANFNNITNIGTCQAPGPTPSLPPPTPSITPTNTPTTTPTPTPTLTSIP